MISYLLDADIVNYLLKNLSPTTERFRAALLADSEMILCPVVAFQVIRYLKLKRATRMLRFFTDLTAEWTSVEITLEDWKDAADLWARRHLAGQAIPGRRPSHRGLRAKVRCYPGDEQHQAFRSTWIDGRELDRCTDELLI